ncbi:hypothetical protein GCM10010233_61490 [Streptomyces pseudogriseolus]|nr:hypothetical protein GCM10010233_61490 [Streptomyces gancidicus]
MGDKNLGAFLVLDGVSHIRCVVRVDLPVCPSSGEGEVAQAGDAEHGAVDAVASEAAVVQALPPHTVGPASW